MQIREETIKMKQAAPILAATTADMRNRALAAIKETLIKNKEKIFEENALDLAEADRQNIAAAVRKRLVFDEGKLKDVLAGLDSLLALPDPLHKVTLSRQLDVGLTLSRVTCPIGVIGVIFEARPDALIQISSLCLKSGNCALLKGGKETAHTNHILFSLIHDAACRAGLPDECLRLAQLHSEVDELLSCYGTVDLLIPRGSNAFVKYIMDHTSIPVLGHADGVCHIYVDKDADISKAVPIITDAKSQYPAACNAVETVLVHKNIAAACLPKLFEALTAAHVNVRGTKEVCAIIPAEEIPESENYHQEFLDLVLNVRLIHSADEAIAYINRYGSHHTDAIVTENKETARRFMELVDSAGVYWNASTRFADGFRYGFGAEVGISTSKIHARGPVGLDGLLSYKYRLTGQGHIVGDYAEGRKSFHFKDLMK